MKTKLVHKQQIQVKTFSYNHTKLHLPLLQHIFFISYLLSHRKAWSLLLKSLILLIIPSFIRLKLKSAESLAICNFFSQKCYSFFELMNAISHLSHFIGLFEHSESRWVFMSLNSTLFLQYLQGVLLSSQLKRCI